MYRIKQIPEDFVVKEINDIKFNENGLYSYFLLKKRDYDTLKAVQAIANKISTNKNFHKNGIGFAGNKDKKALTEQIISIRNGSKSTEKIKIKGIELKYLGKGNDEVYLGSLKGNEFLITIRNLAKEEILKIKEKYAQAPTFAPTPGKSKGILIPNYFGEQRISEKNYLIGKAVIKQNFKDAVELILSSNSDYNKSIEIYLKGHRNDFIGALKLIPFRMLKFYLHSYQSFLFNKALDSYIKLGEGIKSGNKKESLLVKFPLIGFGTEINEAKDNDGNAAGKIIGKIIKKILLDENLDSRDFIIRQIPDLSLEGSERNAFIKVEDFSVISSGKDELNKNMEKITVKFSLPKGSYATILIDFVCKRQLITI
ncbi:tRNA pseudouridine(13) synthase TruD [Candidatus Woesearchaeota archaeon]|nr:tRNA pseudouridine(13) synthase TruD [Candidatus Woesearchaeota archaeon]